MRNISDYRNERPHWSFSSLNLFISICTLKWAFKYVHGEPELTPVNLVFGGAFHRACEHLAEERMRGSAVPVNEVQECFCDNWSDATHSDKSIPFKDGEQDQLTNKGRDMIACLHSNWNGEEEVKAVSRAFCVPILDAHGDLVSEKPLIGEIDCIVASHSDPGTPEALIDWKTSASKWPERKAHDDLQATAFLYGYNMSGGATSSFRYDVITKAKTPAYQPCPTSRYVEDMHRLAELVRIVERSVQAEAFWPNHTSFACSGCQFQSACKAWHRDRARTISQPSLNIAA